MAKDIILRAGARRAPAVREIVFLLHKSASNDRFETCTVNGEPKK